MSIAQLRILERAIRRVKEYHIWDTTIPLTLSGSVNQLWVNSCLMSNYQGLLDVKGDVPVLHIKTHMTSHDYFQTFINVLCLHLAERN